MTLNKDQGHEPNKVWKTFIEMTYDKFLRRSPVEDADYSASGARPDSSATNPGGFELTFEMKEKLITAMITSGALVIGPLSTDKALTAEARRMEAQAFLNKLRGIEQEPRLSPGEFFANLMEEHAPQIQQARQQIAEINARRKTVSEQFSNKSMRSKTVQAAKHVIHRRRNDGPKS